MFISVWNDDGCVDNCNDNNDNNKDYNSNNSDYDDYGDNMMEVMTMTVKIQL